MNYELAKQLAKAGFPQMIREGYNVLLSEKGDGKGSVLFPTLSELIEACGDAFENLTLQNKYWYCNYHPADSWGDSDWESVGKSPKIAVARLWLKLNEKQ